MLNKLLRSLEKEGFQIIHKYSDHITFKDDKVIGYILIDEYTDLPYVINADLKELFDKLSSCFIQLPMPLNEDELEYILSQIKWLKTPERFTASNDYETLTGYPKEISMVR